MLNRKDLEIKRTPIQLIKFIRECDNKITDEQYRKRSDPEISGDNKIKLFIKELKPISIYFNKYYRNKKYLGALSESGSEADAYIFSQNKIIEKIQIV